MNIFILEDDENRMKIFRRNLIGHIIFHADNVEKAKEILLKESINIMFLDHDLGGEIYVDSNNSNTGYQLAKWISENNISYDRVIIHSMNEAGSRNIGSVLKNAEIIPFHILCRSF